MAALRAARSWLLSASRARPALVPGFATTPARSFVSSAKLLAFHPIVQTRVEVPNTATTLSLPHPHLPDQVIRVAWLPTGDSRDMWFFRGNEVSPLGATIVRDSCTCPKCRDPVSGQKTFSSVEIDPDTNIAHVQQTSEGLLVRFDRGIRRLNEDSHETLVPWSDLLVLAGLAPRLISRAHVYEDLMRRVGWDGWDAKTLPGKIRHVDYEAFTQEDDDFWLAMSDLTRFGIVFLKNVPEDPDSVVRIAETIGNIKETLYGRTFDVRAKPNAENIAYTSEYLGLHQDLLYLPEMPKLQLLHCMENSCDGGESMFSDGWRVLKLLNPWLQDNGPLSRLEFEQVDFGYHKNGYNYHMGRRTVTRLNSSPNLELYWSPPFQDPWIKTRPFMDEWFRSARVLHSLLNDPDAVYTRRMQPGECVIFDNQRVLHGRTAFDAAGGSRWLRGTYIAKEVFASKASQMPRQFAEERHDDEQMLSAQFPELSEQWLEKARTLVGELEKTAPRPQVKLTEKRRPKKTFAKNFPARQATGKKNALGAYQADAPYSGATPSQNEQIDSSSGSFAELAVDEAASESRLADSSPRPRRNMKNVPLTHSLMKLMGESASSQPDSNQPPNHRPGNPGRGE